MEHNNQEDGHASQPVQFRHSISRRSNHSLFSSNKLTAQLGTPAEQRARNASPKGAPQKCRPFYRGTEITAADLAELADGAIQNAMAGEEIERHKVGTRWTPGTRGRNPLA